MQLQLWARHDHRTARKIDPLSKQVLTETALFAFQHVRQRFQRPLIGTGDHAAAAAIVEQRIHRFLQHPLFVAHDNIGRAQFDQSLQTVVAVNHTAIKIVQIRRCKPAAIQWHQGAQLRRNHRHNSEDHPFRAVARFQKAFNHFQALDDFFGFSSPVASLRSARNCSASDSKSIAASISRIASAPILAVNASIPNVSCASIYSSSVII